MEPQWDGVRTAGSLEPEYARIRHRVCDAARDGRWADLLALLDEYPELVNSCRIDGPSLYAPLHQAAHNGAPRKVVEALQRRGAWRTLRTAAGERAVDIAQRLGRTHVLHCLEPVYLREVPADVLSALRRHLHEVILGRITVLPDWDTLRLPELEPLLEMDTPAFWFPVPGMYGGFACTLEARGALSSLTVESWCRVAGGSGQRHLVSAAGATLVDEGFV